MNIKCLLGCHDWEPYGEGKKVEKIVKDQAWLSSFEKNSEKEIEKRIREKIKYGVIRAKILGDNYFNEEIQNRVCLRCGKKDKNIEFSINTIQKMAAEACLEITNERDRRKKAIFLTQEN